MEHIKKIPPFTVHFYPTVDSTMNEAKRFVAKDPLFANHVFVAEEQTKGRGRRGRSWESQKGNLYFSILLTLTQELRDRAAELSFVISVALGECLKLYIDDDDIRFKWPNDILVNRKKIAGILLEMAGQAPDFDANLVIGIGLNTQFIPEALKEKVTSMFDQMDRAIDQEELLESLLGKIDEFYALWKNEGFTKIRDLWRAQAYALGQEIQVNLGNGKSLKGRFIDIDVDGALLLEENNKEIQRIYAGDVFF